MSNLSQYSSLEMHDLLVRREDEQVIVGRVASGEFVALPELGARAVELLAESSTIGHAEAALAAELGTPVDLVELAEQFIDLGFVRAVDGHPVAAAEDFRSSLPWLRPRHCRWMFQLPAALCLAGIIIAALLTLAARPDLLPRADDFFWSTHSSIVIAVNTAMTLVVIAVHELAHLAAARSMGVPGRCSLGTRLHMLVAQTDLTGLWALPRRSRYRAYIAGIAWEALLLSTVILILAHVAVPVGARELLKTLALLVVFGLIGQLQLYVRTDLYFILADLLRAKNLTEDAVAFLLESIRRCAAALRPGRPRAPAIHALDALPDGERQKVRIYALLMLTGSVLSLWLYVLYGVPILLGLLTAGWDAISAGVADRNPTLFFDGFLTLGVEGGLQVVFLWVLIRGRGARTLAAWRRTTVDA